MIRLIKLMSSLFLLGMMCVGCEPEEQGFDATGTFEAKEIIVSSEAMGKILSFEAEEGDELKEGEEVVKIETQTIDLQKEQVIATINAIEEKKTSPDPQILVLEQQLQSHGTQVSSLRKQLEVLQKEQARINRMYAAEAATQRQKDEMDGKVEVLQKQIQATESQRSVIQAQIQSAKETAALMNKGINSEKQPLQKKVKQLNDQIRRTSIVNPVKGKILTKYAYEGELATIGKPLYKLADLSEMTLRAFITGDQLSKVAIGQEIPVYVDINAEEYKTYTGKVSWISSQAEFTPKSIQTKDERANLVYAIKLKVPNDGFLKIGMYGELQLEPDDIQGKETEEE